MASDLTAAGKTDVAATGASCVVVSDGESQLVGIKCDVQIEGLVWSLESLPQGAQ
jgi:hypothetical protein